MWQRYLCVVLLMLAVNRLSQIYAQKIVLNSKASSDIDYSIIHHSADSLIIRYTLNSYTLQKPKNQNKSYSIDLKHGSKILKKSAPDLPKFTQSIILPENCNGKITLLSTKYVDMDSISIAPSKGNISRAINPDDVPLMYGTEYEKNTFFPDKQADIGESYIFRDFNGTAITIFPFQYCHIEHKLRVYTEIEVKIIFIPLKRKTNEILNRVEPNEFTQIYQNHFVNYNLINRKKNYRAIGDKGSMLIIAHKTFIPYLNEFALWKMQRGIATEIVDVETIGESADIKRFVADYYRRHNMAFLLLVGDIEHIPTITRTIAGEYALCDADYGLIEGDDAYPEVIVGRFSGQTVKDITTQITRTLDYERQATVGDSWYEKFLLIASQEGPGDDNEYDYQHLRNIKQDLLRYTYTAGYELYEGNQNELDLSGNPTSDMVISAINTGCGILNYTGHGTVEKFTTSGFSIKHIEQLTNFGKYPFSFNVACDNGKFDVPTCFAEACLRATSNGKPTGFIAMNASSIEQDWEPPMCAQDEMIDILCEMDTYNIKRTFGGVAINGCAKMIDDYPFSGSNNASPWIIFGDPSLMLRTTTPKPVMAQYASFISIGANRFTVNANAENADVTLLVGDSIHAHSKIENGTTTLFFPPIPKPTKAILTISGFNLIPITDTILLIQNNSAYLTIESLEINDSAMGNNNHKADFNENISLNLQIVNLGLKPASNIKLKLWSADSTISITSHQTTAKFCNPGDTIEIKDAFALKVHNHIKDGQRVQLTFEIRDSNDSIWQQVIYIDLSAPDPELIFLQIDDSLGNKNGRLDPGEHIRFLVKAINKGHTAIANASCQTVSNSNLIEINNTPLTINDWQTDSTYFESVVFAIDATVSPTAPIGANVELVFQLTTLPYPATPKIVINRTIGLMVEDWESRSTLQWINNSSNAWFKAETKPYEGNFALRSGIISHRQSSALAIKLFILEDDTLSFYKKVSSEIDYDYLEFYIDEKLKNRWSGEIDWSPEKYYIQSGEHEFKWVYTKDEYESGGEDAAWLDYVIFPRCDTTQNHPPRFISIPQTSIEPDSTYRYYIATYDEDKDALLKITCAEKPAWLSFNDYQNGNAILTGTPNKSEHGLHPLIISVYDGIAKVNQTFTIAVGIDIENWETGNFTHYDWQNTTNHPWEITTNQAFDGRVSAKSGSIVNGETSVLSITVYVLQNDSISFYHKVSSEPDYDYLGFYIDNQRQDRWSGDVDWTKTTYKVEPGLHTFSWVYYKDMLHSGGSDCAWIDRIQLPCFDKTGNNIPIIKVSPKQIYYSSDTINNLITITDSDVNDTISIICEQKPEWLTFENTGARQARIHSRAEAKNRGLHWIQLAANDGIATEKTMFAIAIDCQIESWETGNLETYDWQTNKNYPAIIQSGVEGQNCIKLKTTDNQSAELSIQRYFLNNDTLVFYKKVSSEEDYDFLNFYVDDKLYQKWSGEVDWSFVKVPVTKGLHTLKWQYSKDEFTGMGDDCAMLDFIVFPLFNEAPQFTSLPVVSATVKEEYTYYIFAKDEKPESLTISCIQKPDWLHFEDMKNGHAVLQGKPPIAATTGIVKLMVNDSISNPVYQTYTIQTTTTSITHINPVHFSIYPVPAQNFIQIEYMLNSEMEVNLELCTITGKRIKNIENHTQQAGCYTQIIDVSGMVSGVYVCKLVFNKVIFTNKIVILH